MLSRGLVTAPPWRRSLAVTHHRQASLAAAAAAPQPVREGVPLPLSIGPGLQLLSQSYAVEGRQLRLVAPLDVDAVMDAYVAAARDGDPYWCVRVSTVLPHYGGIHPFTRPINKSLTR